MQVNDLRAETDRIVTEYEILNMRISRFAVLGYRSDSSGSARPLTTRTTEVSDSPWMARSGPHEFSASREQLVPVLWNCESGISVKGTGTLRATSSSKQYFRKT